MIKPQILTSHMDQLQLSRLPLCSALGNVGRPNHADREAVQGEGVVEAADGHFWGLAISGAWLCSLMTNSLRTGTWPSRQCVIFSSKNGYL